MMATEIHQPQQQSSHLPESAVDNNLYLETGLAAPSLVMLPTNTDADVDADNDTDSIDVVSPPTQRLPETEALETISSLESVLESREAEIAQLKQHLATKAYDTAWKRQSRRLQAGATSSPAVATHKMGGVKVRLTSPTTTTANSAAASSSSINNLNAAHNNAEPHVAQAQEGMMMATGGLVGAGYAENVNNRPYDLEQDNVFIDKRIQQQQQQHSQQHVSNNILDTMDQQSHTQLSGMGGDDVVSVAYFNGAINSLKSKLKYVVRKYQGLKQTNGEQLASYHQQIVILQELLDARNLRIQALEALQSDNNTNNKTTMEFLSRQLEEQNKEIMRMKSLLAESQQRPLSFTRSCQTDEGSSDERYEGADGFKRTMNDVFILAKQLGLKDNSERLDPPTLLAFVNDALSTKLNEASRVNKIVEQVKKEHSQLLNLVQKHRSEESYLKAQMKQMDDAVTEKRQLSQELEATLREKEERIRELDEFLSTKQGLVETITATRSRSVLDKSVLSEYFREESNAEVEEGAKEILTEETEDTFVPQPASPTKHSEQSPSKSVAMMSPEALSEQWNDLLSRFKMPLLKSPGKDVVQKVNELEKAVREASFSL